jgi:dipeptidyl aminopeptidase/acylaminoacyl peptidase
VHSDPHPAGRGGRALPEGQSEELFVTVVRGSETPAELVLYAGANHKFLEAGKPSHSLDAMKRLTDWWNGG